MGYIRDRRELDGYQGERRWQARYRVPSGPDKGKEKSKTFRRRVDAEKFVAKQTVDKARGEWLDPDRGQMTFAEFIPHWEETLAGLRRRTETRTMGIVENHLLPRFGRMALSEITPTDVKALIADGLGKGLASSTVRKNVIVLRGILQEAVTDRRIGRNPAADVKPPPETSKPMRTLTPQQVRRLAESFREHYRPLIYTAAYVGLRWGELAGLKPSKLDMLARSLTVDEQLTDDNGSLEFGPPKTKAGRRRVSLPGTVVEMLARHLSRPVVKESGVVFPTITGSLLRRSNFRKLWLRRARPLFEGTPLDGFRFHELRHTAASLAIAQGAHPLTVKERLGHSSITVTMDTYGHLFPAQDAALAESLDGVLQDSLAERMRNDKGDETVEWPLAQ